MSSYGVLGRDLKVTLCVLGGDIGLLSGVWARDGAAAAESAAKAHAAHASKQPEHAPTAAQSKSWGHAPRRAAEASMHAPSRMYSRYLLMYRSQRMPAFCHRALSGRQSWPTKGTTLLQAMAGPHHATGYPFCQQEPRGHIVLLHPERRVAVRRVVPDALQRVISAALLCGVVRLALWGRAPCEP